MDQSKPITWSWLLLFSTSGTLVCCALPILLVTLGFGSAVASLAGAAPWLVALSQHKALVFAGSAALLAVAAYIQFRPGRACPTDPILAEACAKADKWNRRFIVLSVVMWLSGFFAAFLLPKFF